MSGGGVPLAVISLRDGSELHVTQAGVKIGERFYTLASIQDARQVAPDPETIALRIAGTGLVEFQPARAGDGAMALEALFRLRPELRPAGFAPPNTPQAAFGAYPQPMQPYPGYPPYAPFPGYMPGPMPGSMPPMTPPQPGYPLPQGAPVMPPPPGFPPPPPVGMPMPFAPNPNTLQPEITPVPRDFGQLLGAIFRLYGKHFRSFLLLGLCVALPLALLFGGIETVDYMVFMGGPSCSPFMNTNPSTTHCGPPSWLTTTPSAELMLLVVGIGIPVVAILALVLIAWQTAALGLGARDAVLGRRIRIGASVRGGLRRLMPTLGAQFLMSLLLMLTMLPLIVLYVLFLTSMLGSMNTPYDQTQASQTSALFSAYVLSICLAMPFCFVLLYYFMVRLGFAPYAAATMRLGPGRAIAASWRLTRGNWWRTFFVIFIMSMIAGAAASIGEPLAVLFPPAFYLVIYPAIQVLAAPLIALTNMVLLSDLRLRHEGYASAVQDAAPGKGAGQTQKPDSTPPSSPPTQTGEATQQQQSGPPLG